jgi:hypothetical protein
MQGPARVGGFGYSRKPLIFTAEYSDGGLVTLIPSRVGRTCFTLVCVASFPGFSLYRVFGLSIVNLEMSRPGLEPGT